MLGCGAGWIREEYDALGVDFATRGKRFDEMIDVLRKAWTRRDGRAPRSLLRSRLVPDESGAAHAGADLDRRRRARPRCAAPRRSATAGSATGQSPDDAHALLARLRELRVQAGRARQPFETIVPLTTPPDADVFKRLGDAGMTATSAWPFTYQIGPHSTIDQKRDLMLRFGESVIAKLA